MKCSSSSSQGQALEIRRRIGRMFKEMKRIWIWFWWREELHRKSIKDAVYLGTTLVVQWLRLCFSTTVGTGLITGQGTKIPHTVVWPKKKKFFLKSYFFNMQVIHIYWMPIYASHSVKYWGYWKLKKSMWRRKWQPIPVFLPGESQGQRSLVGCCLWGRTESGQDWSDLAAAAAATGGLCNYKDSYRFQEGGQQIK